MKNLPIDGHWGFRRPAGEKCGIFGVYGSTEAAKLTFWGLYTLQHRGQESSGMSVTNGLEIQTFKKNGLVSQVYREEDIDELKGQVAIGHNRYSTSGGTDSDHNQPVTSEANIVVVAHNGNLPSTKILEQFLNKKKISTQGLNDTELMHKAIEYYLLDGLSLTEALENSFELFTGSFSLLVMTKDSLAVVRDPCGIRPLAMGKLGSSYVFASETCAFDLIGAVYIRDVRPGEMIVISDQGMKRHQLAPSSQKLDVFEIIYFARPDSYLLGKSVYMMRRALGEQLAKEHVLAADIVVGIPDSGIPAAEGYAAQAGIPYWEALTKNRYIPRTFIQPYNRETLVEMKFNPISDVVRGKRVIMVDDSIVRGTTSAPLIEKMYKAGAVWVALLNSSPEIKFPDFYGIDIPVQKKLLAFKRSNEEIRLLIGCDYMGYLSYEGMIAAIGLSEDMLCTSSFSGVYPIDIGERRKEIVFE